MTEKELFKAIGEIDDAYVLEASPVSFRKKRTWGFVRPLIYAAAALLIFYAGMPFLAQQKSDMAPNAVDFYAQEAVESTEVMRVGGRVFVGRITEVKNGKASVAILRSGKEEMDYASSADDVFDKDSGEEIVLTCDHFPEEGSVCLFEIGDDGTVLSIHDLSGIDYENADLDELVSLIGE